VSLHRKLIEVSFIKIMPTVQVLVRVIGEGGDLASSEFTMTDEVMRSWSAGELEDPFDLARELGATFWNSLRNRIESELGVFNPNDIQVVVRRNQNLIEETPWERIRPAIGHIYFNSEPESVGLMPVRTELTELNLPQRRTLIDAILTEPIRERLEAVVERVRGRSEPEPSFASRKKRKKEPMKKDRTTIPSRYKRSPVI
jgi:hypothetical protein